MPRTCGSGKRAVSPNSASCERVFSSVFSLLKNLFGEQQMAASLMLNYNGRNVG